MPFKLENAKVVIPYCHVLEDAMIMLWVMVVPIAKLERRLP